jgi:hypothetical protein
MKEAGKKINSLQPDKMVVALTAGELAEIVEAAVDRALEKRKPAKLLFDTKEAAAMLNVPDSWLAAKTRAGEVPYHQAGHYRLFSLQDINKIIAQFSVDSPALYCHYRAHDGQEIQDDQAGAGAQSVTVGEGAQSVAEHNRAVGQGREPDPGPRRSCNGSPSRKKTEGED